MVFTDQFSAGVTCTRCQELTTDLASCLSTIDTDVLFYSSTNLTHTSIAHFARCEWFLVLVTYLAGVPWLIEHVEVPQSDGVW
ncbi:MAG: hypothetical protein ACXAC0_01005 [Candidatus Thorarchaeota archaeon]